MFLAVSLIAWLLANVADVYTTVSILDRGGRELNPVMRWVLTWVSDPALALSLGKIAVTVIVLGVGMALRPQAVPVIFTIGSAIILAAAIWNWRQM